MLDEEKNQNQESQEEKTNDAKKAAELDEVITPSQTGEIVEATSETTSTEEKVDEVSETDKVSEVVEDTDKASKDSEASGESTEEDTKDTKSDESDSDETVENVQTEENNTDETVEEGEEKETTDEGKEKEEEVAVVEEDEVDIEQLKKELAELKVEKEEEAKVKELVEVAQHVEAEYDRVVKGINEALKETLEQYHIPTDKTIQELEKEDPAKAEMARALIAQAKQALDFNTQQLSQVYKTKEQDVIFSKAERLFNKYEMSNEQAQVAADTFISILNATGLQDLDEDLATKVELSVAQAKFRVPEMKVVAPKIETVVEKDVVEEKPEEVVIEEKKEEKKEEEVTTETTPESDKPEEEFEIKKGVAKQAVSQPKVDLSAYKEGIEGSGKAATAEVDTANVLHKLASLPYKERQAFLKKNFNLVNQAMREVNIKKARDRK